ncbi:hypothetical protein GBZ26_08835 [Azospirillum formosense]|uniref:Uncharacterized protein n=1 Tax=Azospirillum formosense TaxID=861533 RepID=A0ABX2KRN2_9PROT|nr:hypothetical protein [Azospirillum formosense]
MQERCQEGPVFPLPPREREGAHAKRGKGEGTGNGQGLDSRTTLTRRLRRHPLPGREREWIPPTDCPPHKR